MTKGDNNPQDDTSLYRGLRFLRRSNMYVFCTVVDTLTIGKVSVMTTSLISRVAKYSVGKVQAYMPYVGYVTIVMNDYRT